jgi:hypothetical protein
LLCFAGRCENGPLVGFQHSQPRLDVLGVILPWFSAQAQVGACERGPKLGYEFLSGIGVITKALS